MEKQPVAMMDRYLALVVTNDPSGLPVAGNLKRLSHYPGPGAV